MLEKLKSSYIFKIIFSFIDEGSKLKLIKCNKTIQKKINISLINYKHFQGSYIIYESNGIGKEYNGNDDILKFEGEYLNGKRNGKGKEYYKNGKIKFAGNYLNGKKNGNGKEYDYDGTLLFEGEYLNGKRNGKGKEYDSYNGKLKFEGEYLNGRKLIGTQYNIIGSDKCDLNHIKGIGKICDDYNDRLIYEGEYLNGQRNGKGKEYYSYNNKIVFEGEYLNGQKNGKGKEYNKNYQLIFEGEYLYDRKWEGIGYNKSNKIIYKLKEGKGIIKEYNEFGDKLLFEGDYLYGKRNGKGKEFDNDKLIYEGEYLNGNRNGKGIEYSRNGKLRFEGVYLYNYKIKGKLFINEKLEFEGEFLYNKKWNGKGYDKYGNIIYELNNGNGRVKEYNDDGELIFEGEYLDGKKREIDIHNDNNEVLILEGGYLTTINNGEEKIFDIYGQLIYEGKI